MRGRGMKNARREAAGETTKGGGGDKGNTVRDTLKAANQPAPSDRGAALTRVGIRWFAGFKVPSAKPPTHAPALVDGARFAGNASGLRLR
ncbi:hypothetical protein SAMD00023378_3912 [Ralstonia sp. NT80]|nr:hypothetical protein SAMD00023378_3912 [Ralstonia sp. NT80]